MSGFIGRIPVEQDPWADAPDSGGNEVHQGELLKRYAHVLGQHVHAVETAAHNLHAKVDSVKLARMTRSRAEIERVRDVVSAVFADLLAALPPERPADGEGLVDRVLGRARRR